MVKSKIASLYERLSRDDELQGESFSIQNQAVLHVFHPKKDADRVMLDSCTG